MDLIEVPILETERLRLRPFLTSDIDNYAALHEDPEVMRYVGGTWDRGRSSRHLAFLVGHWQLWGSGMWAVEHRETGAFVGKIGFSEPEGWPGCELAWYLARRYWGFGYATEGARAALDYGFTSLKKDRIISQIESLNLASIRVAERLGMSLQGRCDVLIREHLVYGIDRERYAEMATSALALAHAGTPPRRPPTLAGVREDPAARIARLRIPRGEECL